MSTKKNNKEIFHDVDNARVRVWAPKPANGNMFYQHCVVTERHDSDGPAFSINPHTRTHYAKNKRIFCLRRMKVHTRKDGSYMLSLHILPDSDKRAAASLCKDFDTALRCTFDYEEDLRKGGKR